MPTSTRFAVGVHLLTALATNPGRVVRSEIVAGSVNTNPVVVRRLFSILADAGLVRATLGHGGGFELARDPETITLLDVYRALEDPDLFASHRAPPDPTCAVGQHILGELRTTTARAAAALERELAGTSIADVMRGVLARGATAAAEVSAGLRN